MTQSKKVYDFIMTKIQSGEWKAGDKILSENELVAQLDVSRIAVRESCEKLAGMGLIQKVKGSGTYVAELNLEDYMKKIMLCVSMTDSDLMNLLDFRVNFESSNVADFMKNHTEEDVKELHYLYDKMLANRENGDFFKYDFEFHRTIAKGTKNPIILAVHDFLNSMLFKSQETINYKVGPDIGTKYHKLILEAIEEKDSELATLLMRRHIEATIDRIKKN
ncbi:MAG: FadR family transcriptional regulator [Clostridia bacterium]|nr:FadR family transcriptional regulator [Clostridia bacterium]